MTCEKTFLAIKGGDSDIRAFEIILLYWTSMVSTLPGDLFCGSNIVLSLILCQI